jgi:hypothetical protein
MPKPVQRQTVDLTGYPDLVVIYLGMRVRAVYGLKTLFGLGPQIEKAGVARPEGLLHYENNIIYNLFPLHLGMALVLERFRLHGTLGPLGAAPDLVAELSA